MPVSVAALLDGTRFYVASYVTATPTSPCPDPTVTAAGCVIPQLTVFDAATLTVKTTIFPLLPAGRGSTAIRADAGRILRAGYSVHSGVGPLPHVCGRRDRQQSRLCQHV